MVNSTPLLVCAYCGASLPNDAYAGRRRYCSDRCVARAYRGARREELRLKAASRRANDGGKANRAVAMSYLDRNREQVNESARRHYREAGRRRDPRPLQARAHAAVAQAIKAGRLVRGPCEVGVDCRGRVEGHHDDYDKPLDVRWLCSKHHGQHHRKEHDG